MPARRVVRANTMLKPFGRRTLQIQAFCPEVTQSPSSCAAVVRSAATSEPASGSVSA